MTVGPLAGSRHLPLDAQLHTRCSAVLYDEPTDSFKWSTWATVALSELARHLQHGLFVAHAAAPSAECSFLKDNIRFEADVIFRVSNRLMLVLEVMRVLAAR